MFLGETSGSRQGICLYQRKKGDKCVIPLVRLLNWGQMLFQIQDIFQRYDTSAFHILVLFASY